MVSDLFQLGNLFTVIGDEGPENIYYKGQYGYNSLEILPEVKGFVPYPSPTGDYWGWAFRNKTGIWITENNSIWLNYQQASAAYRSGTWMGRRSTFLKIIDLF